MTFGKLYTYEGNVRSIAILAVAKANNVDLEIVSTDPSKGVSNDYKRINHLGKVPSFVGSDGYELVESIAIAIYITSQNEKTTLLGKTKQDYASIVRWMSFANHEILALTLAHWFKPLVGREPYNKKNVDAAKEATMKAVGVLEQHLLVNTFLVAERITLADLFVAGLITVGFRYVFDKQWRSENPNVTRWYETVYNQPIYSAVVPKLEFIDEAIKFVPPQKEKAPKKEEKKKEEPKPTAKEVEEDEEEEEAKPEPNAKHPLDTLPKPTFNLKDVKDKYSNCQKQYRKIFMPWFWDNYKPEEYSMWQLDFNYPEELGQVFMSSNAITGIHTRLEASRKYLFGASGVYGEPNASVIRGAYILRGQDADPVFDVAPDYTSFTAVKLDTCKPEVKEFIADMWCGDKDTVNIDGKEMTYQDSKEFK